MGGGQPLYCVSSLPTIPPPCWEPNIVILYLLMLLLSISEHPTKSDVGKCPLTEEALEAEMYGISTIYSTGQQKEICALGNNFMLVRERFRDDGDKLVEPETNQLYDCRFCWLHKCSH